ncbi:hypothetical protein [Kordiimonas marina]|uniref:hypothetical protein n=1 Tax=Kordiimonas marina TaxID=2872312 RepID=UPI001FF27F35|nr:hypothetical protein [Kordiimonas marina]MCJ9430222.1 hypothetical protein [Kordiimonas marina]
MRVAFFLAVCALLFPVSVDAETYASSGGWQVRNADIEQLESKLSLPKEAYPLGSYQRYYQGQIVAGHKVVLGHFLHTDPSKFGVVILSSQAPMPRIFDGGCIMVTVRWNYDAQKTISVACNGRA